MKLPFGVAALLAVALTPPPLCASVASQNPSRSQRGTQTSGPNAPKDELPPAAAPAVERFGEWAKTNGYRIDVDRSQRAMLISLESSDPSHWFKDVDAVFALLDERAPAPLRGERATEPAPKSGGGTIPEDPEEPVIGTPSTAGQTTTTSSSWGAGTAPLDSEMIVMFMIKNEVHFASLLAHLTKISPALGPWAESAAQFPGFALEDPLAGAVVLDAAGQEEWSERNELVHRVAELALLRRFGRQPYWVLQGWAWFAEYALCKSFYCFPYRNGFVGIGEHDGWHQQLKRDATQAATFSIDDLVSLRRGAWDDRGARMAWGLVQYLQRRQVGAWPKVLEDLRIAWDKGSQRELGPHRWERIVGYEAPAAEQLRILETHTSETFLKDLTAFCRTGFDPKAKLAPLPSPKSKSAR